MRHLLRTFSPLVSICSNLTPSRPKQEHTKSPNAFYPIFQAHNDITFTQSDHNRKAALCLSYRIKRLSLHRLLSWHTKRQQSPRIKIPFAPLRKPLRSLRPIARPSQQPVQRYILPNGGADKGASHRDTSKEP